MNETIRRASCMTAFVALLTSSAAAQDAEVPQSGPDALEFSVENMDLTADPRVDFQRFAAGRWLDRVERPAKLAAFGMAAVMQERLSTLLRETMAKAAEAAATAPKGSPAQQVGAFYAAYMDTAARDAAGVEPIRAELDAIAAIETNDDLVRYLARWIRMAGVPPLAAFVPSADAADNTRYALFALGGDLALTRLLASVYDQPEHAAQREAYRTYITGTLKVAGYAPGREADLATMIDALEVELHAGEPTPAERIDPYSRYHPMSLDELQSQIPELDLTLFIASLGFSKPDSIVLYMPRYFPVLSQALRDHDMQDIRDYLSYRLIRKFSNVLSTDFDAPSQAFRVAMTGVEIEPTREEKALALTTESLGQPLGQVYVDAYFSKAQRERAAEVIGLVRAAFLARIPTRAWLTDATHAEAMEKAEALYFKVGYPDAWIDFSGVEIGSDPVANLTNIARFDWQRTVADFAGPVKHDPFSAPSTLPEVINAAYIPAENGFQVPAAFLQSPVFQPDMDAPVWFCRLGATLGHEMTHGFDSQGRNYDAKGNLHNWWTAEDEATFTAEARKLVEQADAYEALPGLNVRGAQTVGENMADVGGINFAYDALTTWLQDHPEQNVEIDGYTPAQRCFIAWAQLWTEKTTDAFITNQVMTNEHPPNNYRATAALQHVDAFYEAFGIGEGDPMWLPPEKRVRAW